MRDTVWLLTVSGRNANNKYTCDSKEVMQFTPTFANKEKVKETETQAAA